MEASRNAVPAMCERAAVVTAEVAVINDRSAVGNVVTPAKGHAASHKVRAPRVEAPAKPTEDPQPDSNSKPNSESHHYADRNRRHNEARVGDHQRSVDDPGIVIRNSYQKRIDRRNQDRALLHHHGLLRRRNQDVPFLRRVPIRLDRVHHVFRLIEIGVAQLRGPRRVLRQIVENSGELRQAFDGRVPRHRVRTGCALIRWQRQVRIQPGIRRRNLVRIRGGCQHLRHQRVRVESKRAHQLVQLLRVQGDVRCHRLRVQIQFYCCRNQHHREHRRQRLAHGSI